MSCVPIRLIHTESFRLAAIYAAIFVISFLLFSTLVYFTVDGAFRAEALRTTESDLATVASAYRSEGVPEAEEVISQSMAAPRASDFLLLAQDGKKLAGNLPLLPPRTGIVEMRQDGHPMLGRGVFLAPGLYLFAGRDLAIMNSAENSIARALAWVFGGALIAAACGGILLSRSFLKRMDAITRTCRAIMEGRFADRIAIRGSHDELDGLALAINQMLDRIATLMENLKQVSSDIAHDLRLIRHVFAELLHERVHLRERDGFTAGDVHDEVLRVLQEETLIDQRALEGTLERLRHPVGATCFAEAKEAS